jgi:hypothetical protein
MYLSRIAQLSPTDLAGTPWPPWHVSPLPPLSNVWLLLDGSVRVKSAQFHSARVPYAYGYQ